MKSGPCSKPRQTEKLNARKQKDCKIGNCQNWQSGNCKTEHSEFFNCPITRFLPITNLFIPSVYLFIELLLLLFRQPFLRSVVAFAVDRGHFRAHGAEIGGELSAMVDSVIGAERQKADSRKLEHAAEVDALRQRIGAELFDFGDAGRKRVIEPFGDDGVT